MWYNTEECAFAGVLPRPGAQHSASTRRTLLGLEHRAARSRCIKAEAVRRGQQHLRRQQPSDLHRPGRSPAAPTRRPERRLRQLDAGPRIHRRLPGQVLMQDGGLASAAIWRSLSRCAGAGRAGHGARRLRSQRHRAGAAAAHRDDLRLQHRDGGGARPRRPHRRHRSLYALSAGGARQAAGRRPAGLLGRRGGGAAARPGRRHAVAPGRQPAVDPMERLGIPDRRAAAAERGGDPVQHPPAGAPDAASPERGEEWRPALQAPPRQGRAACRRPEAAQRRS